MIEARSPRFLAPNTTPDPARARMSHAWAFVLDCHAKKQGSPDKKAAPNSVKGSRNGSRRDTSIPKTY